MVADDFQDRAVQDLLRSGETADGRRVHSHVLAGMAGTGKSQLAAHHADQLLREGGTDLVVWVNAASVDGIRSAFAGAAVAVGAVEPGALEDAPAAFVQWLGTAGYRWLVVLDDLRDATDMRDLWPPERDGGQVVITTRRRDPHLRTSKRDLIEVGLFSPGQSSAYLDRRFATHDMSESPEEVAALADELGHLPLALAQAASFLIDLCDTGMTVARYRALLREWHPLAGLAPEPVALPDDQRDTLAGVLGLSLEHADRLTGGLATPILQLASLLDPSGFPASMLTTWPAVAYSLEIRSTAGVLNQQVDADLTRALRTLHRLSLVNLSPVHDGGPGSGPEYLVAIHALTQHAAHDTIPPGRHGRMARGAGGALFQSWPQADRGGDITTALRASAFRLQGAVGEEELWGDPDYEPSFLLQAGRSLGESGQVAAAAYFDELAATAARWFDPEDPYTLSARYGRAFWRCELGDPAGAAEEFAELVEVRIRVLGGDHVNTLVTRGEHARCLGEAGNSAEAVRLLKDVLKDQVEVFGPDDQRVFTTRNNLASWEEDPDEALEQYRVLLADEVRVLGPDHPGILTTRENILHLTRRADGTDEEIEEAFQALLEDQERILGPDHPDILHTRSDLAEHHGNFEAAAAAMQDLLAHRNGALGPDHPRTLAARHKLIGLTTHFSSADEEVASYEALLRDMERVFGPDHQNTLITRHDLVHSRHLAGDTRRAVAELEHLFDHPALSSYTEIYLGVYLTLRDFQQHLGS